MEEILSRFPHLSQRIFNLLDNNGLEKSKEVDRYWNTYIAEQKFYSIRIIKATLKQFQEVGPTWNALFAQSLTKMIIDLQKTVQTFYQEHKRIAYSRVSNCLIYCSLKFPCCFKVQEHSQLQITPLHIAAYSGDLDLLKYVRERNQLYLKDYWGCTPLHLAAHNGHLEMCQYIIDAFGGRNTGNGHGHTPFHEAASHGHLKICELFIHTFDEIHTAANNGNTPLHEAAKRGHLKICEILVKNLVDKNPAADYSGWTPLHCAAFYGHLEVFEFFMGITDNINPHTIIGKFPLYFAADNKHMDICELMLKRLDDKNPQVDITGLPYRDVINRPHLKYRGFSTR